MNISCILSKKSNTYNMFMGRLIATIFGKNLRAARLKKNITQSQMAEALNIGLRAYQNYESGSREPSLSGLWSISQKLNITIDELLKVPVDSGESFDEQ